MCGGFINECDGQLRKDHYYKDIERKEKSGEYEAVN